MKFKNYETLDSFFTNLKEKGHYYSEYMRLNPLEEDIEVANENGSIDYYLDEKGEINFIVDIQENGMALLIDRFEKKHNLSLNIKIISTNATTVLSFLENILTEFSKKPDGSKLTLLLRNGDHWTMIHCNIKQN